MKKWIGIGAICSMIVVGPAAGAVTPSFPLQGGSGDIRNSVVCDDGYIKGFRGETANWVKRLTVICTHLNPDGSVPGSKSKGSFGRGSGIMQPAILCDHKIVFRAVVNMTADNRMVAQVLFNCTDPVTDDRNFGSYYFPDYRNTGGPQYEQACPPGEAAVGVTANWGEDVNAMSLICGKIKY
jgi:hypothetical protein